MQCTFAPFDPDLVWFSARRASMIIASRSESTESGFMTLWQRILRALELGIDVVLGRARDKGDKSEAFTIGVIALGAKLSKADGQVTRDEVRAFRDVFHVPEDQHENVAMLFNLARQDVAGFDGYARNVSKLFDPRSPELERLMACLFHIASADGEVSPPELDFLSYVAEIFGW
ncbi:MAG: hypothetical protein CBC49_000125, partial [Alphaproteobacteria bacterium TMED89]